MKDKTRSSGIMNMMCFPSHDPKRRKEGGPSHVQCVNVRYDGCGPERSPVPPQKISWVKSFDKYMPITYTSEDVMARPRWADPLMDSPYGALVPSFNQLDGAVDRRSWEGPYRLVEGVPQNPRGRTGLIGRGVLGRWGPNHTATPIITRCSRDRSGALKQVEGARVLEVVAVRSRTGWALPCELVMPGDRLGLGTRRAFLSELLRHQGHGTAGEANRSLSAMFSEGITIYRGYVDDAKNTDNAWLETVSVNFHDKDSSKFGAIRLAADFAWVEAGSGLNIFCKHKEWLREVVELQRGYWCEG